MIKLFNANSLSVLARKLAEDLVQLIDPFSEDWIIVQNKETQRWLQSELSRLNGISANIKFIYPSELAWQVIRLYKPELPIELPTDRVSIQSRIFDLLTQERDELSKRGLVVPEDLTMCLNLSDSISDVFDLYQTYRPSMLLEWGNSTAYGSSSNAWQTYLWNRISSEIESEFPEIPSRYKLDETVDALLKTTTSRMPTNINVFGLSHWSDVFFELVKQLSNTSEIRWYDQELIIKNDHQGRFQKWASSKLEVQQFFQSSTLNVKSRDLDSSGEKASSSSINIHSCYNAEREIQVLRNELLHHLDKDAALTVDDILILVPDFEKYGPIIENEFKPLGEYPSIPVYVPDIKKSSSSEFLIRLMDFILNGEKVTEFIELINHPIIRYKFDLDELEIGFYNQTFADMNIHNGLTVSDSEFSIDKGVNQLLLSYSMSMSNYETINNYALINLVSSTDAKNYIAKLSTIHRLFVELKDLLSEQLNLSEWLEKISSFLDELYSEQDSLVLKIQKLINQLNYSNPSTKISFETFNSWFKDQINDQSATATRSGTGVLVSSYIPYRNIPFKIVAVLGLNEGVFPRNKYRPDFDLINQDPKPGDRIAKEDDTLLFYERLITTEQHIHLSYIGEGESSAMPSTLIQELYEVYPELETYHHPLHDFSNSKDSKGKIYPSKETDIVSFINKDSDTEEGRFNGDIPINTDEEITLSEFISFFAHPSKHLLTNILGVNNIFESDQPNDREAFMLDGLDRYHLKSEIGSFLNLSTELEEFKSFGISRGIIPRGPIGQSQFAEESTIVESIFEKLNTFNKQDSESYDVNLQLNEIKVSGRVSNIYDGIRVSWKLSKIKARDILGLWINHLVLKSDNLDFKQSVLIGLNDKNEVVQYTFDMVNNPKEILESYAQLFDKKKMPKEHWSCIPSISVKFVELYSDPDKQLKAMEKEWFSTDWSRKEDSDYYNQTIWKDELPWNNHFFKTYAKVVWEPLLELQKVSVL